MMNTPDLNSAVTLERLEKCIQTVRRVTEPVGFDSLVMHQLGFESIDVVDLLFVLEQEFGGVMTMLEFNQFVLSLAKRRSERGWDFSVGDLAQFVSARL